MCKILAGRTLSQLAESCGILGLGGDCIIPKLTFGALVLALPLTVIWQQGNMLEDRDEAIADLKDKLESEQETTDDLDGIIRIQREVIKCLGRSGRLVNLPVGTFTCTAYEASEVSCGKWADGITSEGIPVGLGIAAADHRILPAGTVIFIHKLQSYFIVMDKGGMIKGHKLDLYTTTVNHAMQFGVIKSKVSIIKGG